jgi:hypothetical protein
MRHTLFISDFAVERQLGGEARLGTCRRRKLSPEDALWLAWILRKITKLSLQEERLPGLQTWQQSDPRDSPLESSKLGAPMFVGELVRRCRTARGLSRYGKRTPISRSALLFS